MAKPKSKSKAKAARKPSRTVGAAAAVPDTDRILNVVPSTGTEEDWVYESAVEAAALGAAPLQLPASIDLRENWWNVGDQGRTGSCVGWSSTDGVARYHFVKANRLAQNKRLSPRFTWMASKEIDEFVSRPGTMIEEAGTSLKAALDVLRKFGAAPDEMLPFSIATNLFLGKEQVFYATTASRKIASYFNLRKNLADWRSWLANSGPLLVALTVDETWMSATSTNGILDIFRPMPNAGGHAVVVVGYRADGRFIIRNSWGTTWGDRGFAYASASYIEAAFFDEAYGVTL